MSSFGATCMIGLLRLVQRKRVYASAAAVEGGIRQTRAAGPARPGKRHMSQLVVVKEEFASRAVYRVRPEAYEPAAKVIYLHGGAYIRPITSFHWDFICELAREIGCEFVVPLYPLAPESQGLQALEFAAALYAAEHSDSTPMFVMGDSAGAGLALSLAMTVRDSGTAACTRLFLITPFVDAEVTSALARDIEPADPMLAIEGVRAAGRLYAGPLPTCHPAISPARGDLAALPPMSVYVAGRDILGPDALSFVQSARAAGCDVDLHVEPEMVHAWPLFRFKEARKTRGQIVRAVQRLLKGASPP